MIEDTSRQPVYPLGKPQQIPVDQLIPYPDNPRNITDKAVEQVAKSIQEFGWAQPIVVDQNMTIIIGHTRHKAAQKLGEKMVPVIVETRLTPDQVKALRIADNRAHDYTTWAYPLLLSELEGLDESFGTILDLADWQDIIAGFEDGQDLSLMDLDPEELASLTDRYSLTVMFVDKESAEQAAEEIMHLPGVINVRYSGR